MYLYLDAIALRVRAAGRVTGLPVLAGVAVLSDGTKRLVSLELCGAESGTAWEGFLQGLIDRGLKAPRLCIIDGNAGLCRAITLASESCALVLLHSLVASGQINLRRIDGYEKIVDVIAARRMPPRNESCYTAPTLHPGEVPSHFPHLAGRDLRVSPRELSSWLPSTSPVAEKKLEPAVSLFLTGSMAGRYPPTRVTDNCLGNRQPTLAYLLSSRSQQQVPALNHSLRGQTMRAQSATSLALGFAVATCVFVGCGGPEGSSGGAESGEELVRSALFIGPSGHSLDYTACADENGICVIGGFGASQKYLAYGANGGFFYRSSPPGNSQVPCTNAFFGGDPAPNVAKKCYFANYTLSVAEGTADTGDNRNIAFGANGVFNFKTVSGSYRCDTQTFGDPIFGVVKACYAALVEYAVGASEGGLLTGLNRTPIAYGANGKFLYQIASGSVACTSATFGSDPAPGASKACYSLAFFPFVADEGGTFNVGSSPHTYLFGSGLDGNFVAQGLSGTPSCTVQTFGADPAYGVIKHCY